MQEIYERARHIRVAAFDVDGVLTDGGLYYADSGEELKIVTNQFAKFEGAKDRLDVLALDGMGRLVVIEVKRDTSGGYQDLQALRYAAFASTFLRKCSHSIEMYSDTWPVVATLARNIRERRPLSCSLSGAQPEERIHGIPTKSERSPSCGPE